MYFEHNADGKIMICSAEEVAPNMVYIVPPDGFSPDEMHDWQIVDGELVYNPLPVPESRTQGERLTELEEAFDLILSGVTE